MRYSLKKLGLPAGDAHRLAQVGVDDSDHLLVRASTPELREQLATDVGVTVAELTRWASVADLVRIKGLGPAYARQIVAAGLAGSVQEFLLTLGVGPSDQQDEDYVRIANRPLVRQAAQQAQEKLKEHLATTDSSAAAPGRSALAEAAEEAAELRPRLALRPPDTSQSFRARVMQQARSQFQIDWRGSLRSFGALYGFEILLFSGLLIYGNGRVQLNMRHADALALLESQIELSLFNYTMLSFGVFSIAFVTVLYLFLLLGGLALEWAIDTQVALWLFDVDGYRKFYRQAIDQDLDAFRSARKWTQLGLLGFCVVSVLYTWRSYNRHPEISFEQLLQRTSLPVTMTLVLLGVILAAPTVRFFLRRFAGDQGVDAAATQRFFVLRLIYVASMPVIILALIWIVPRCFDLHSEMYLDHVLPHMETVAAEGRSAILALDEDQVDPARRDLTLLELESEWFSKLDTLGRLAPAEVDEVVTLFLPLMFTMLAWLIVIYLLAWFVLPYLVLGGVSKGIFYAILLAITYQVENRLTAQGATWFGLGGDTLVSGFIVAFLVFANALIFDWLFNFFAEREKACPHCGALMDARAMHCADCGMVQPYQVSRGQRRHRTRTVARRLADMLRQRVQR